MDVEKLIERLRTESLYADKASLEIMDLCMDAAAALSTLQAENEKLRTEVERLEYERDYPCIYFKAGGLCRYGGDESEANICVMGPCEVETTAEDVDRLRAELERAKQERDAAVKDLETLCRDDVGPCEMAICELCAYNSGVQCSNPDGRSCDGYDVFNWKWRGQQKED